MRQTAHHSAHDERGRALVGTADVVRADSVSEKLYLARGLVFAFLAGEWTLPGLVERGTVALGERFAELDRVARLALRLFPEGADGRDEKLTMLLSRSRALAELCFPDLVRLKKQAPRWLEIQHWYLPAPRMARALAPLVGLPLPPIADEPALARLLDIPLDQLDWYVDAHRLNRAAREPKLRHYRYRWLQKRSGAYRLLEAPKPRLKRAQRRVLDHILTHVPVHDACHGHQRGRSVKSFAAPHVGQRVVVRLDLAEFYSSVRQARVRALFAALGYPDRIAANLAALCTTPTPEDVLRACPCSPAALAARFHQRQVLRDAHLPQGAPSSSALANLAAYRLDLRLYALAAHFDARYTRYADDLAFSGGERFHAALPSVLPLIGAIVIEEGFAVRHHKTRVMVRATRQQLCGVVVNDALGVSRRDYERLEAILTNCIRRGAATQNREGVADFEAHLRGRVAWVTHLHREKGAYLASLLARIDFGTPSDQSG